jgi:putative transposase
VNDKQTKGDAMNDCKVISLIKPTESIEDALTTVLRQGAQDLLCKAIESEVQHLLKKYEAVQDEKGTPQVVRNGYLPERTIQSGVGPIAVKVPRVRDRSRSGIKFHSSLIPPYLRRTKNIEELLPLLYLKGISTGDFSEALTALIGPEANGLSSSTICRLKEEWQVDYAN